MLARTTSFADELLGKLDKGSRVQGTPAWLQHNRRFTWHTATHLSWIQILLRSRKDFLPRLKTARSIHTTRLERSSW
ncbi:hypothetical protein PtB15_9B240 [Puccinia triticina]|nr:hypothetical protein PtB15_9B240 [Puccinia triticina]